MRVLLFVALLSACTVHGEDDAANVNSKYTVESVIVEPESVSKRLNSGIKGDIAALVGQKFDPAVADKIRGRISEQFHRKVEQTIEKGDQPEYIKLI